MGFTFKSNSTKDKSASSSPKLRESNGSAAKGQLSLSISSSDHSRSGSCVHTFPRKLSPNTSTSQKTAKEIFKIIAENKLCVVRKFGAEANTSITTIVEAVCRKCDPVIEPTFLHVNQLCAGEMLDCVQRQGLPLIFVNGDCIGGLTELRALDKSGFLVKALKPHDFDLIVVGGGTGGIAAALEAAKLDKKVACLDYLKPASMNSLNDNCLNIGSDWRRMMHQTALLGEAIEDAQIHGWQMPDKFNKEMNWEKLKNSIQKHTLNTSLSCKRELLEKHVTYINSDVVFTGTHEITSTNQKGNVEHFTANRFLLAIDHRPKYLEVPGARNCCITSDDLFSLPYNPKKTLCVGGTSASLECAGFLKAIGNEVTVLLSTSFLEGSDREMANRIRMHMTERGVRFEEGIPLCFEQLEETRQDEAGLIRVTIEREIEGESHKKNTFEEKYNTIILAIGKETQTQDLGLEKLFVCPKPQKLEGKTEQCRSLPNIYYIGGFLEDNCSELRNLSKQAGQMLVRRLYTGNMELMDYDKVPAVIFTPLQYAGCGLSEDAALAKYGAHGIHVYQNLFSATDYVLTDRMDAGHYCCKLVCLKEQEEEKVVGLHILSPNAVEIVQGFALALKFGAKKADFDWLSGIHPMINFGY